MSHIKSITCSDENLQSDNNTYEYENKGYIQFKRSKASHSLLARVRHTYKTVKNYSFSDISITIL